MAWTWDNEKNRTNKCDHGLSFESAQYVFRDLLAVSRPDPYPHEERWQTIGMIGNMTIFVVHTWPDPDPDTGEETGRIISAREATPYERRAYEEGTL
ncbi:BrnT family toxin [Gloeobacter kilaueensis]|uniref:BrnT family toxin n=1 Tax=Gloeobacter kilaueensis TaxID=1416614 RepID=UPI00059BFB9F